MKINIFFQQNKTWHAITFTTAIAKNIAKDYFIVS